LVENTTPPAVKLGAKIGGALTVLFIAAVIIIALIEGIGGQAAWVIVAISLLLLVVAIGFLIKWLTQDKLEGDRIKYIVILQAVSLIMLSASILAVVVADEGTAASEYMLGGTSSGISGSGLILSVNNDPSLVVSPQGSGCSTFYWNKKLASGTAYSVAITNQASDSVCAVGGQASGKITNNNFGVTVTCSVSVGGRIQNLKSDGLVLQNSVNGGSPSDMVAVSVGNATFTFPGLISIGSTYKVEVNNPPTGQSCNVADGEGTATSNVFSITVACSP